MLKIIDGRRYNTETATEICTQLSDGSSSDFRWEQTTLYRTKKGQHILSGEGGAMSQWGHTLADGSRCFGEGIRLIDEDTARRFAERHGTAEDVERHFTVEEG